MATPAFQTETDALRNTAPCGMAVKDNALRYTSANDAYARARGVDTRDMIGRTDAELLDPDTARPIEDADRFALDSGQPARGRRETVRGADGAKRSLVTGRAPFADASGNTAGLVCTSQDVTEFERISNQLRETETKYQNLFETDLVGLFRTSLADGTIIGGNNAAAKIINYNSIDDIIRAKVKVSDYYSPERRQQLVDELQRKEYVSNFDAHYTFPDGTEKDILISARLFPDRGYLEGVVIDITERKRLENELYQSEKMKAIGLLAGGIAHDFNNQLTGIISCAELLRSRLSHDEELLSLVDMILSASQRSSDLTGQLLAFARKGKHQSVTVDLHVIVGEVIALLKHSRRGETYIAHLPKEPLYVVGDPTQLQNAILNVALNARDALPEGGEVTIAADMVDLDQAFCDTARYDIAPGAYVRVRISDTGTGIDEAIQDQIFDPFFTTKTVGAGTGMGLAAVDGIVKSHRGTIDITSEVDKGTTVSLFFPRSSGAAAAARDDMFQDSPPRAHVMIVDDEDVVRAGVSRQLEYLGFTVSAFRNGEEALASYRESFETIDVVMLDMVMPVMSGYETYRALKEVNPSVRAIFASGHAVDPRARDLVDKGDVVFLNKPFDTAMLVQTISRTLALEGVS
ncbi:MAG: response regulator [Chitinivibrionales bacterium]|nr:response regulator [Chitinivibrionales bacterium]MBD3394993.1 response regulator [Chitinivibrionales bacterium]